MSYLYLLKIRFLESLAYRFEMLSAILIQFILLSVNAYFWKALYRSYDTVQGTTLEQMLTYSITSLLLSCFFSIGIEDRLRERIREGNISVDFIKPVSLFGMYLAEDIGGVLVSVVQKGLPILLFAGVFIQSPRPASVPALLMFLVSIVFSYAILWLISAIIGLFYFWLIDIGPVGGAIHYIISFLSGSIIPIWFFPEVVQKVLVFTPFIYTYQTPIGIYIGRTSLEQGGGQVAIQFLWTIVFLLVFRTIKSRVMGNIAIQGG